MEKLGGAVESSFVYWRRTAVVFSCAKNNNGISRPGFVVSGLVHNAPIDDH
jgi:hypothetical protein